MVKTIVPRILFLALFLAPIQALADIEPPIVKTTLDAIEAAVGVRPTYRAVSNSAGVVTITGLTLDIPNPVEPDDVNATSIGEIRLEGVETASDGFRVAKAMFAQVRHRAAAFSMEVLQIDALYSELGVDPPGSLGRSSDETVEIASMTLNGWKLRTRQLASVDWLGAIVFGGRSFAIDRLAYFSQGATPLIVTDIAVEDARKRSAGETWRYRASADLTAPWLEALAGTLFTELGYARVPMRIEAETFRLGDHATGKAFVRAEGAFNLLGEYGLDDLADNGAVSPAPAAILAHSPDAALEGARLAFVDAGMARRAMTLMVRQTGATPQALASALAQQAGSALRRAGYARIAAEAEAALANFLVSFGHIAVIAQQGPLARYAAMGGAGAPAALEAAGVTVSAE